MTRTCQNCGIPLTSADNVGGCPQTWCKKCIAGERVRQQQPTQSTVYFNPDDSRPWPVRGRC